MVFVTPYGSFRVQDALVTGTSVSAYFPPVPDNTTGVSTTLVLSPTDFSPVVDWPLFADLNLSGTPTITIFPIWVCAITNPVRMETSSANRVAPRQNLFITAPSGLDVKRFTYWICEA